MTNYKGFTVTECTEDCPRCNRCSPQSARRMRIDAMVTGWELEKIRYETDALPLIGPLPQNGTKRLSACSPANIYIFLALQKTRDSLRFCVHGRFDPHRPYKANSSRIAQFGQSSVGVYVTKRATEAETTGGPSNSLVSFAPGRRNEDQRCQVDHNSQSD